MNKDEIIRMAREAGDASTDNHRRESFMFDSYGIEHFAALVAAAEREACAVTCEDIYNDPEGNDGNDVYYTRPYLQCADEIRARSQS